MKKIAIYGIILSIFVIITACQHVDAVAQAAARQAVISRDMANMISISARAFGTVTEEITPEQEYYIGRAVAANILTTYKIWDGNPELTSYLNLICAALVINSPQPSLFNGYQVAILDSNEINAFATSGGHIFITRGLVNVARTEDALAGVIAHEVAHIQLQHSIKSIKSNRLTQAIMVTATAGAGAMMGMDVNELVDVFNESVGEIVHTMVGSGYSREQEYEADVAAMYLLALAGYQPSGLIDMLTELESAHTVSSGFGRTHPTPGQRIYFAERAINRLDVADTSSSRQERFINVLRIRVAGHQ